MCTIHYCQQTVAPGVILLFWSHLTRHHKSVSALYLCSGLEFICVSTLLWSMCIKSCNWTLCLLISWFLHNFLLKTWQPSQIQAQIHSKSLSQLQVSGRWLFFWLLIVLLSFIRLDSVIVTGVVLHHQEPEMKNDRCQSLKYIFKWSLDDGNEKLGVGTFWIASAMTESSSCWLAKVKLSALSKLSTLDSKFPSFTDNKQRACCY